VIIYILYRVEGKRFKIGAKRAQMEVWLEKLYSPLWKTVMLSTSWPVGLGAQIRSIRKA